jgi:LPS-assembly protein
LQTLEPRLFYDYIPYRDQDELPDFDTILLPFSYSSLFTENRFLGYDRIGDVNKLATGITSRIINDETGRELWRFRLGQGFYFDNRRVNLLPGQSPDTARTSPIVADATFQMDEHWNLYAEKQWDNGTDLGKQNILRLGYHDPVRRYAYLGYRNIDTGNGITSVRQGELAGMWPVSQHWSLLASELFSLDQHRSLETVSGAEYRDCCWKIRLVNRRLLADYDGTGILTPRSTWMLQIQMIGLGGFGNTVDSLLENTIPGYRRENQ